jgi:hypothetical protein
VPPMAGACPKGTAFADGCAGAQPGAGIYPTMLDVYGANRPPWNVAGVDYRVGADEGPFKDPLLAANLPACASVRAGTESWVSINSVPCTIEHTHKGTRAPQEIRYRCAARKQMTAAYIAQKSDSEIIQLLSKASC